MKKRLLQALITGLVVSSFIITPVMATPQENVERLEESVEKLEENVEKLEGITGEEPLCFAKQQDLLCGTGMAWCREIRLYRNGEQVDTDCIRELSREKAYVEEYETSASDGKEDDETP